jgi:hypothetical protein
MGLLKPKIKYPITLYKYMPIERFQEHLDDYLVGKLYFADKEQLNDPMEAIPMKKRMSKGMTRYYGMHTTEKGMSLRERIDMRVGRGLERISGEDFSWVINDELGRYIICSLTTRPDNFAMWSHYANNHTGVCLGVNINYNLLKCEEINIEKMKYTNHVPYIHKNKELMLEDDIPWGIIKKVNCVKYKDWKYESEWRLLANGMPRAIKIGEISEIILGYKCQGEKALRDLICAQSNISISKVEFEVKNNIINLFVPTITRKIKYGKFRNEDWMYKVSKNGTTIVEYIGESLNVIIPHEIKGINTAGQSPAPARLRRAFRSRAAGY